MNWETLLRRHSEFLIVSGTLVIISAVFHWIPYKIAFLSFFYLPVLAAGYLMGARRAMLCGVMCMLLVVTYYFWEWTKISVAGGSGWQALLSQVGQNWPTLLNIAMWGGFLIVTGGLFGKMHGRLLTSWTHARELNEKLAEQASEMQIANETLRETTAQLEQQSEVLQEKNLQIEQLKQKVEQTLYSTMDSTVARLLIQGRLREQKSHICVLFCDLKGFTGYAHARNPEVALEDLNRFYEVMEKVIESYCGHIDKTMGDGIMCEFGAPIEYQQHGLQAVVAALMMQKVFREKDFPWNLRIGLASGEAIVGMLGSRRRSYSAIGEVVNLAKRLEELCEETSVYVDEATWKEVRHLVEMEPVRNPVGRRAADRVNLQEIAEKQQQLDQDPQNADLMFAIGKLYFSLREATRALSYFRQALDLKPDNDEIKLAYAEASIKLDDFEKIVIKGIEQKQMVFKAIRTKDPLLDRQRFRDGFCHHYHDVSKMIEIPDEVTLPVETLDGTVGHSLSVSLVSYALADRLGLSPEIKRDLLAAGRIQDLGKSVVWHHILNRRGGLSDQERKELERHVDESVSIAKRMGFDRPGVIEIIASHHERLNGEGYPRHAKGEEIPLAGRISGVADTYCALTERRPYRNPWDAGVALNELQRGAAGGVYDAGVVDALCKLMA